MTFATDCSYHLNVITFALADMSRSKYHIHLFFEKKKHVLKLFECLSTNVLAYNQCH